jgi:glycosyltransferase involved in cell wall biosynthesis
MKPYLLVAGDFVLTGGMDMANFALARYLAEQDNEVHLVAHRVAQDLAGHPNITVHHVPKLAGSYLLSAPLLDHIGRYWASRILALKGRVLVNGGNCRWGDANWVHYIHAAYRPRVAGSILRYLKSRYAHRRFLADERAVLRRARIIIANSERTKSDMVERLKMPAHRIHTVYYGIDRDCFRPPSADERACAREALGWLDMKPVIAFVGALGDRRKGFDTLFEAWKALCVDPQWDANLAVIGTGAELPAWKARTESAGLKSRIHFLGFRHDVPKILAGCDALVAPTRYEAYGLGVQEALCRGLPALVTRTAGVAERYSAELQNLLIPDPEDVTDLMNRLRSWRARAADYRIALTTLAQRLRSRTWDDMAAQIVNIIG